jgi:SAM-dependent methyltransferase
VKLLSVLAPRFSKRRLILSILRDFRYRPRSIVGRLSSVNFVNHRVCQSLAMHCNVCGADGPMSYDFPDAEIRKAHGIGMLRETLRCRACAATMRDRQIAFGLLRVVAERLGQSVPDLATFRRQPSGLLRILDSDSFSPINRVLRGLPGYQHSQFVPGRKNGERLPDGSVVVDLENIPFPDASFDVVLTSDVMEHVGDDDAAHREIFRCLDRQGAYIFTIPYDPSMQGNRLLTVATGMAGAASHLFLEKHVHGDPHASSGIVAHRIYGRQLLDDLASIGFQPAFLNITEPAHGIFGGDLFVARKEH